MSRKGIFALEEMTEEDGTLASGAQGGAEAAEAVVIDEAAGAEDLAQADEHFDAAAEIEEAANEATATVDTLGEIHKEVGNSLAEGGMSEPEARALEIAVEHMCAAIGMPKTAKKPFPAMEGFADKTTRISNTKYAMEGLADKAKDIGQRIWKAIVAALEYAKKFFASLFNATEGLKKKADQIVEASKKAGNVLVEQKDVPSVSGNFLKLLTVDGSYQVGTALVAAYKKHTEQPIIKEDRMALIREIAPIMEKALSEKDAATADATVEKAMDEIIRGSKVTVGAEADEHEEPLVFAGQSFYQKFGDSTTTVSLGDSSSKKEVGEMKEAPALTPKVIQDLAGAVSDHMEAYKPLGKDVSTLSGELNAILQKVKAAMSGNGTVSNAIYSQIQTLNNVTVVASKLLRSYDVKVSSAILEYCVKSLKAIPKPEKATKNEEVPTT